VWNRDGRTVQANNATGTFLSRTFVTRAVPNHRPRIAVAPGHVVVGWTTPSAPFAAFVAERVGTTWTGATASATGGNATATILSLGSRLYAATET
jgi:hypothetical protein